ncbi:MAG: hypothetical protein WBP17_05925 [Gemmatimonadota bacterium]
MPHDWTVVRIRGNRGLPALDGAGFLGCIGAVRSEMEGTRWHYRWVADADQSVRDGLRVEFRHGSPEMARVAGALENLIPPPDSVETEPLRMDLDLDDVQNEEEMDVCLSMLWRYSELMADLRARSPSLTATSIRELTPQAFLTFVTGDRRHLEKAMREIGVSNVPVVAYGRAVGLIREARLRYQAPATTREDACAAARIHHLAGCTFASPYYPFRRAG